MGHREDLLEGAKRCLLDKGFMRTTARDIVKESGTNLASIGYHYGSKDALLAQAYISLVADTGDAFEGDVDGSEPGSLERFQQVWTNIIGTMKDPGSVWRLSMEALAFGDRLPEVRDHLAALQREAGRGLIPLLMGGREEDVSDETADTLGMFYVTLMTGLIAQWTFDPKSAPGSEQLTAGLRQVVEAARATGGAP
ncbi:TetR/AcrR family transcriptional regulator [Streptomyces sp. NPDC052309]|uniref:TetR/AcrR family transcriptional regulator n=1 Tax=Streptomyces griseicoloratus TaxID=2752516 RepID=A0A926L6K1_9ACTN|nr:TetR/AcrR family transcriptional regulator [Streptomyces griseicoloratus]MBD0421023.1 TetR/AcrR family transcriptional regulator [Streptomyces griseicoloratus]